MILCLPLESKLGLAHEKSDLVAEGSIPILLLKTLGTIIVMRAQDDMNF